jgi:dipeptidyl aminopeptidase/acylaminoacyl peptidase
MQEKVTFKSAGLCLAGIMEFPNDYSTGTRRPAIIILHGFGVSKDSQNVTRPASLYTQWGYIVLRFDMRGCGDSEGEFGRVVCLEQVEDARNAISYLGSRPEVIPERILVSGNSAGAAIALYTAGIDSRPAAVISASGWGNGERKLQGQHPGPGAWEKFKLLIEQGKENRARTGKSVMIPRHEIVPIPPNLRSALPPNSVKEFPLDVPESIMSFRPEDVVANIAPRPLLILHAALDSVTPTEESIQIFRRAKQPVDLHLFNGVDHFIMAEGNLRVTEVVRNWLSVHFPSSVP